MNDTKLDAAIESRAARLSARFIVPALLAALVSVVSYIGGRALGEQQDQGRQISSMAVDMAQIRGELSGFKDDAERSRENTKERLDIVMNWLVRLSAKVDSVNRPD